jgi:glycosyltransferase involved in cell wall biosynthesis
MITLSFCAIVKNEAQNLARCLASVKPYVDELVVVDTGSTDETIAIAQQYGAKVSHFEWCDDFALARNYACFLASGDWILTLDADEELEVSQENWKAQLLESASENIVAFSLGLRDVGNEATEMQTPRLFRNLPSAQYRDRYHEYLTYEGQALSTSHPLVKSIEGVAIIHYGYAEELLAAKSLRRIPILEQIRATDGLSLMLLWTLSGMYEATEALDQAQGCYEEAWERLFPNLLTGELPQDSRSVRSWLYSLAVRSLQSEDVETSQFICEQGIKWFPDHPPLFYLSGLILKMSGSIGDSISYFEHCLEAGKIGKYSKVEPFDQALITVYPAFDLGVVYLALEQTEKAIAAFELAISFDPNFTAAQEHLAIIQSMNSKI